MKYDFKCKKCNKIYTLDIKIKEYDDKKDNLFCEKCNGKLERVFSFGNLGIKTSDGVK
jgi:putative FmdB family regulatory protein